MLSVREAVWLTDSNFTYQDLVLRLADIVAALKGDIQVSDTFCCLTLDVLLAV